MRGPRVKSHLRRCHSILHATKPILGASKLPSLYEDPLDKAEGVGLRPIHVARKVCVDAVKCMPLEAITVRCI